MFRIGSREIVSQQSFSRFQGPNYVYSNVEVLAKLEVPDNSLGELALCRTVGILQSFHDQVFVCGVSISSVH